jgi:murein DD-endopeptidase MepM/ murein hydrolase activator NlpD
VWSIDKGDTIDSIAKKYSISGSDVALFNGLLLADDLNAGDEIFLPGATSNSDNTNKKSTTKKDKNKKININTNGPLTKKGRQWSNGDTAHLNTSTAISKYSALPKYPGYYIIPSPGAVRTQKMHGHNAVDLANSLGSPILAAASGVVRVAKTGGYNFGYGNYIIITHPNGTETVYGHLLRVGVEVGQSVSQGQQIGLLGSTGDSTGPHVHFEIHGAYNPWAW